MEGRGGEEKESSSHKPLFIAYSPKSDDVSSAVESEISLKSQKSQNNETLKEESMRSNCLPLASAYSEIDAQRTKTRSIVQLLSERKI